MKKGDIVFYKPRNRSFGILPPPERVEIKLIIHSQKRAIVIFRNGITKKVMLSSLEGFEEGDPDHGETKDPAREGSEESNKEEATSNQLAKRMETGQTKGETL